ncbi:MAG: hypothetical protein ACLUVV_01355 [Christensenellales bacterium]
MLTFREVEDLFAFAKIHLETLAEDDKEHSSAAGRSMPERVEAKR